MKLIALVTSAFILGASAEAQTAQTPDTGVSQPSASVVLNPTVLPPDTVTQVTSVQEITSIQMKQGDSYMLQVAADVAQDGIVIIPRGAPVKSTITWRTGKGIGGKSAKFEITFNSVTVHGHQYALLGSIWISGHSAVMTSGQMVNAFTAEPILADTGRVATSG